MADLLSYPFRVTGAGTAATVPDGSAEQAQELLADLLLTKPGERPLAPEYGVNDPAFQGLDDAGLRLAVATFGPDVEVVDVETTFVDDTTQQVRVTFR